MTAPRNRADAEARRRRHALEPRDERELIVGRSERRGEILEARGGRVVEAAELEQRERRPQDPRDEERGGDRERREARAAALVPPHRDRRGDERARAVARDEQRPHVVRDDLHADQHDDHAEERPHVAQQRGHRRAARREALRQGVAAQEEEPRRADDEPQAPDLRGELGHVREQCAHCGDDADHDGDHARARRDGSDAAPDAARDAIDDRQHPRERPAEGLTQKRGDRQREHAEPQMPLVIKRKIAIAEIAVRRQVEEHQPPESGRHHESGISDPRRNRLRARRQPAPQPRGGDERNDCRGHETEDVRCGPIEEAARSARGLEPPIRAERPRHASDPRGERPREKRERDAGHCEPLRSTA
jgi:hypothetical protein